MTANIVSEGLDKIIERVFFQPNASNNVDGVFKICNGNFLLSLRSTPHARISRAAFHSCRILRNDFSDVLKL
eukprot:2753814-Amphidinium_carterae.1